MAEFYASCPEGFEDALADELRGMGLRQVRKLKGRVNFAGEAIDAERACLWSRLASRVFTVVARIDCATAEDLYAGACSVAWENVLRTGATIAVTARGTNDELRNSHFSALRVKDAICDRLTSVMGTRPMVDTDQPDARVALTIRGERASLELDLSGEPLFKRLPREAARMKTAHVLRPDYAALVLAEAGWMQACAESRSENGGQPILVDACCAGGGLELEAAGILLDRAPGRLREHWGFMGWTKHDADGWNALIEEADARADAADSRLAIENTMILATDTDAGAVEFARRIVRKAGLARYVAFAGADAVSITQTIPSGNKLTTRPVFVADATETPLNQLPQLIALLAGLRGSMEFAGSPLTVLTRDEILAHSLGTAPARSLAVKPNNEDARILVFAGSDNATEAAREDSKAAAISALQQTTLIDLGDGKPAAVLIPESEQFARRLQKVARQRRKWAKREGITCYRVYDADLPDYAAAIDLYEGSASTPGRWLVIAEYAAPRSVDPALAQTRLLDILTLAPRILGIDPNNVYAKARLRSRGGSQYGKRGASNVGNASASAPAEPESFLTRHLPLIEEGGLTFAVNFDDYLDTGIFLDHRITRGIVRERARGKRFFCNLFAYTGTATCYAADAGVEETVTVDLSNTYLDWAERNMRQNGFTGREHHYVRADVMRWISDMRQTRNRWDLIFCDPPTFSNSSKMGRRTWDVQRDHAELIIGMSRLLTREGEAIFSCNLRTFKPDIEKMARAGVVLTDITAQTIPEDFARNQRIHHCYIVRRYTVEEAMRLAGLA